MKVAQSGSGDVLLKLHIFMLQYDACISYFSVCTVPLESDGFPDQNDNTNWPTGLHEILQNHRLKNQ